VSDLNPEMVANLVARHDSEQLAAMYLRAECQMAEVVERRSALLSLTEKQALTERALRRELKTLRHTEPLARDIAAILKLWRARCVAANQRNRVSIDLDGPRAALVRRALKTMVAGDRKERRRMCMDAVRGLSMRPYVGPQGRTGDSNVRGTTKRNDIRYALMDEQHIEEHAGFWRALEATSLERKEGRKDTAFDIALHYLALYQDACYREGLERRREQLRNNPVVVSDLATRSGFTVEQLGAAIEGRPLPPLTRPTLFVIEGGEAAA
jgi:hypothetical protein